MSSNFSLSEYMGKGIENIVKGIVRASIKNPKETIFAAKFAIASQEAKKKREQLASKGETIPAFLIASITSTCNLFCKGCYARNNKSCGEGLEAKHLSSERWEELFREAKELGISFILLAGGEPLLRKSVIEKAAEVKEVIFPIFTNGTLFQEEYIKLFDNHRNLIPILSIEGDKDETDSRRGIGTYDALMKAIDALKQKGILYGVSVTVTTENIMSVTSETFLDKLHSKGCRALIYVEYVPVEASSGHLAPSADSRQLLEDRQQTLRKQYEDTIFLSFPGDEKYSGGCLAAGRGFFHIGADGAAEPCPFSPYSDTSLKSNTLREALKSPLFKKLHETGMLLEEHDGGCVLFEKEDEVKALVNIKR